MGGDTDRYDAELRPELMRRAIEETQDYGIEVDIWKIEGVDTREDCEMLARTTRREGRDGVVCVLLGRGASDAKVDHWLRQAAPVDGFVGFAIGRSIWWDALKGFLDGNIEREAAADQIADNYLRFIEVYRDAEQAEVPATRLRRRRLAQSAGRRGAVLRPPCWTLWAVAIPWAWAYPAIQARAWNMRSVTTTVVARIARQSSTNRIVPGLLHALDAARSRAVDSLAAQPFPAHDRIGGLFAKFRLVLGEALTHPHRFGEATSAIAAGTGGSATPSACPAPRRRPPDPSSASPSRWMST